MQQYNAWIMLNEQQTKSNLLERLCGPPQDPPFPSPEYSTALQSPAFAQKSCMVPADLVMSAVTAQDPASEADRR